MHRFFFVFREALGCMAWHGSGYIMLTTLSTAHKGCSGGLTQKLELVAMASDDDVDEPAEEEVDEPVEEESKNEVELIAAAPVMSRNRDLVTGGPSGGRTGGVYVPPFKLAMMRQAMGVANRSSEENQKQSWEALRKSINGLINKVNVSNIKHIIPELFQENLVRGRGLFARAIMKAQQASPGFTHIYTALLAIINTKLPENGELVLKRVIYGFKRAYKRSVLSLTMLLMM